MRKLNPEFVDVMHNALAELRGEKEKLQEMAMEVAVQREDMEGVDAEDIEIGISFFYILILLGFAVICVWPAIRDHFGEEMLVIGDGLFVSVSIADGYPAEAGLSIRKRRRSYTDRFRFFIFIFGGIAS